MTLQATLPAALRRPRTHAPHATRTEGSSIGTMWFGLATGARPCPCPSAAHALPRPFPDLIASHPSKTFTAFVVDRNHSAVKALKQGDERICYEPESAPPVDSDLI